MHLGDCYIWSEIYYLDSPTDYRECLPPQRISRSNIPGSGLTNLENFENNSGYLFLRALALLGFLIGCYLLWDNLL